MFPGDSTIPDPGARELYSLVPLKSKWYTSGVHVEVVEHTTWNGNPAVRVRGMNSKHVWVSEEIHLFLRHAERTDSVASSTGSGA